MPTPIRFGIAGAGLSATFLAGAIARVRGARLSAVCRTNAARAAETATMFGVPCETSFEALVARPDVDAIGICTPSGLHAPMSIAAARAGKHVFVDKPMALSLAAADEAIATARARGVLLSVILQRRTDPQFARLAAAVAGGALGRPVLGSISVPYLRTQAYYESAPWRASPDLDGGGVLINQAIHLLDLLLWFLGDVERVRAHSATLAHHIRMEDCLTASLVFKNGALGAIASTTATNPGFPHRVEVYGSEGGAQIEGEKIVRWETQAGPVDASATGGTGPASAPAGAAADPAAISLDNHARLVENFVDAIRRKTTLLVPGEEGRRSLAVVLAAYESAKSGKETIVG
jgi:UDP-N-acetyl-2-amino-2-deoxyglucuronate dehydrogenase